MPLRMTHQREILLEELKKCGQHLSADELYERVRKTIPRISLATVYRNLEILAELGVVGKLEISGRQKRFDYDVSQHDHIFCLKCHRVDNIDMQKKHIPAMSHHVARGYSITGYRLEFAGICPECKKKHEKETK